MTVGSHDEGDWKDDTPPASDRPPGEREPAEQLPGAPAAPPFRPSPPLARRLNRNALTVVAALAGVTVLTVLVVAGPSRVRSGSAASNVVDAVPPVPAEPAFLNVPPKLPPDSLPPPAPPTSRSTPIPPPLPGLLPDQLSAQGESTSYQALAPRSAQESARPVAASQRQDAYRAALTSSVLVGGGSRGGGTPSADAAAVAAPPSSDTTSNLDHATSTSKPPAIEGGAPPIPVVAAGSPYTVRAGTIIPGLLITGVSSDVPGNVLGQTSRDVFDSRTQRTLLVPKGSRLVGTYDSRSVGSGRLIVLWSRLIFPDGRSLALPKLGATDERGLAGLHDQVNHHYGRIYGTALLLSAIGAGVQLSEPQQSATLYAVPSTRQVAAGAVGQQLSDVALENVRRGLDVPPTITIRPGQPFNVFLTGDIVFDGPYAAEP